MNTKSRSEVAQLVEALEVGDAESVVSTISTGRDADGYWVADNGEYDGSLSADEAINIIMDNLRQLEELFTEDS